MAEMKIYLAASGARIEKAAQYGPVAARLWTLGRDLKLRRAAPPRARAALAAVDARAFSGYGPHEALARGMVGRCRQAGCLGLVPELPRPNAALTRFCEILDTAAARSGLELYLPPAYARAAPGAFVLIPAQNTGGTYEGRLRRLSALYGADRLALLFDARPTGYLLPCRAGVGQAVEADALASLKPRFSPALCANTASRRVGSRAQVIVWDDDATLRQKLATARTLGITRGIVESAEGV